MQLIRKIVRHKAFFQTYNEQMGSTPFGDIDPALAGLVAPRDIKFGRGIDGCARVSDRI